MCKFFSFVTYKGKKYYFDSEARKAERELDSHSKICSTFLNSLVKEDKSNKYEFTKDGLIKDSIQDEDECFDDVKDWMNNFQESREFWSICVRTQTKESLELVSEDMKAATEVIWHEYACWCAEQVLHLYEEKDPNDNRPRKAIEAKRLWLEGKITDKELEVARAAAWAAEYDAEYAAGAAAGDAAGAAAWAAASDAASDAAGAARAAAWSAGAAAREDATKKAQQEHLDFLMESVWPKK